MSAWKVCIRNSWGLFWTVSLSQMHAEVIGKLHENKQ